MLYLYNLVWGSLCLINREAVYEKYKLFQTKLYKYNVVKISTQIIMHN
jgi:hypothetical protein